MSILRSLALTPEQALIMAKTRPREEFYDFHEDPFELKNLAADPSFRDALTDRR